jgi:hypothetical protein
LSSSVFKTCSLKCRKKKRREHKLEINFQPRIADLSDSKIKISSAAESGICTVMGYKVIYYY